MAFASNFCLHHVEVTPGAYNQEHSPSKQREEFKQLKITRSSSLNML
jgi:hypothetical protein